MEAQEQLKAEIIKLEKLIVIAEQQGDPKYLIKMYQSLIKTKKKPFQFEKAFFLLALVLLKFHDQLLRRFTQVL